MDTKCHVSDTKRYIWVETACPAAEPSEGCFAVGDPASACCSWSALPPTLSLDLPFPLICRSHTRARKPAGRTMITNFFVLSPRGDTVIAKTYRSKSGVGAHERSHTEAFFRKVKFWDGVAPGTPGMDTTLGLGSGGKASASAELEGMESSKESKRFGDAPPVFVMPDGYSYMHVKRNGLIFGCATEKNVSPVVVIEVRNFVLLPPLRSRLLARWICSHHEICT